MPAFCCPKAQSSIKLTMRLTYPFHTIRQGFHTIKLKFLPDFLHYSKLITIFADEFQVLLREGMRFNDSNLVKRVIDVYPVKESEQFFATSVMAIVPRSF